MIVAIQKKQNLLIIKDYIKCIDLMKKQVHYYIKAKGGSIKY